MKIMKKTICIMFVILLIAINTLISFAYVGEQTEFDQLWSVVDSNNNGIPDDDESFWEATIIGSILGVYIIARLAGVSDPAFDDAENTVKEDIKEAYRENPETYKDVVTSKYNDIVTKNELDAAKANQLLSEYKERKGFDDETLDALDNGTYFVQNLDFNRDDYYPTQYGTEINWENLRATSYVGNFNISLGETKSYYCMSSYAGPWLDDSGLGGLSLHNDDYEGSIVITYQYNDNVNGNDLICTTKYNTGDGYVFSRWSDMLLSDTYSVVNIQQYAPIGTENISEATLFVSQPFEAYSTSGSLISHKIIGLPNTGTSSWSSNYNGVSHGVNQYEAGVYISDIGYLTNEYTYLAQYLYEKIVGDEGTNGSYDDYVSDNQPMQKIDNNYYNTINNNIYNPEMDYSKMYDAIRDGIENAKLNFPNDDELKNLLERYLEYQKNNPDIQDDEMPQGLTQNDIREVLDDYFRQVEVENEEDVTAPETESEHDYSGILGTIVDWLRKIRDSIVTAKNKLVDIFEELLNIGDNVEEIVNPDIEPEEDDFSISSEIKLKFPFCIPWDFMYGFSLLSAPPVDPVFVIPFNIPMFDYTGGMTIDLRKVSGLNGEEYDMTPYIKMFRYFVYLDFLICLIVGTKSLLSL